jgi:hypothetical protein
VAVDTIVVFSWGSCHVQSLAVTDVFGRIIWRVDGRFGSPVTYGTAPSGSTETQSPETLQAGSRYSVLISGGSFFETRDFIR